MATVRGQPRSSTPFSLAMRSEAGSDAGASLVDEEALERVAHARADRLAVDDELTESPSVGALDRRRDGRRPW